MRWQEHVCAYEPSYTKLSTSSSVDVGVLLDLERHMRRAAKTSHLCTLAVRGAVERLCRRPLSRNFTR